MATGAVRINDSVKNLTGGTVMIDGSVKNLTGGAMMINGAVKKFNFSSKKHIYIVRSYDGNATSYCRTIVNGTTYNDTNHVVVDSGTSVGFFVMSVGAMAASAKIVLNGTTIQAGPGSHTMTLDRNIVVQYARGGSGTKLYYEIYISDMPEDANGIWLFNKTINETSMPITATSEEDFMDMCKINLSNSGKEYDGLYVHFI